MEMAPGNSGAESRQCMAEVLPFVDLVIGNEEDAADVRIFIQ